MEAPLYGEPGPDIDISIHAGRAYVRMVRSTTTVKSPGDFPSQKAQVIVPGWVGFDDGGLACQAILHEDGQWTCDEAPQVAAMLNRDCRPAGDSGDDGSGR